MLLSALPGIFWASLPANLCESCGYWCYCPYSQSISIWLLYITVWSICFCPLFFMFFLPKRYSFEYDKIWQDSHVGHVFRRSWRRTEWNGPWCLRRASSGHFGTRLRLLEHLHGWWILVVWNMTFMTFHINWGYIGNVIIPTDELL